MPRRAKVARRVIAPDPIYANVQLGKFVNCLMEGGKKTISAKILYASFEKVRNSTKAEPLDTFNKAISNATPVIEVKPRRVGGATYQVPIEIGHARRLALARRWLIRAARARSGRSMADKLAAEFIDAANGVGAAIKRREETHKMAESNKAFSHFKY